MKDFDCKSRDFFAISFSSGGHEVGVSSNEVKCFAEQPIPTQIVEYAVESLTRCTNTDFAESENIKGSLPFADKIASQREAKSHIAQNMLARLNQDVSYYAKKENDPQKQIIRLRGISGSQLV